MPKPSKYGPLKPIYQLTFNLSQSSASKCSLTYSGREDGIGAQIHSLFSLHAYAKLRGMTVLPQALSKIAHNDQEDPDWDDKWNRFFNLPRSRTTPQEPYIKRIKLERLFFPTSGTCYVTQKAHTITDLFPESYHAVMPELRKQYDQAPIEKTNFLKDDTISVAIHLRLGDVANHSGRSSRIDRAVQQISTIRKYLEEKGENFEILVLSQGSPASFTPLVDLGAQLHLNEDLFKTFHTLVCADILCMAKSSLSYAAALLNQKTVIYEPFWHPKLPNWLNDANQLAK
tara:strand:- start:6926 stop:7783 length:858 start_codon:yes stop_codon:yes gene_type:complete